MSSVEILLAQLAKSLLLKQEEKLPNLDKIENLKRYPLVVDDERSDMISKKSSEGSGWDYWTKVYEDPELRHQLHERNAKSPSVSEMLTSVSLCAAELIFLNVPRLPIKQQAVVRSLIGTTVGRHVPVLDITIQLFKWRVRFYRVEDAEAVQKTLDGHNFRDKMLVVRFNHDILPIKEEDIVSNNTTSSSSATSSADRRRVGEKEKPAERDQTQTRGWTRMENTDLDMFKDKLMELLQTHFHGMSIERALAAMKSVQPKGIVAALLKQWPTGLLRLCSPHVKMYGNWITLVDQNNHESLTRRAHLEGASRDPSDSWEPSPPCNIRNDYHLIDYAIAFLTRFGPQHVKVDGPFRLLSCTLSGSFPTSAVALATHLQSISIHFVFIDDVIYLASNVKHRRALLDFLRPAKLRHCEIVAQQKQQQKQHNRNANSSSV